jgi:4-hydroxy-L-threonine phosphate dehydrogenase PdxA
VTKSRIAIALGDPNGIGPEIAVKTALACRDAADLTLIGDGAVLDDCLRRWGQGADLATTRVAGMGAGDYRPGELSAQAGAATVAYVRAGVAMALRGEVDALISCPCSETAVNMAGIRFAGFQPLLAELTGTPADRTFMMLIAEGLRIAHATLHEGVRSALDRMTPELVCSAARETNAMLRRLGMRQPRLALFGINPHAGEDGLFGDEDERITKPAARALRDEGLAIDGPLPADLVLSQRRHDGYVAMFHDQGHIPIKLLSPLRATSLTLGTPIVFASVAHGCAHDIAGTGAADPTAMQQAVRLLARHISKETA